jgi:hypothetical protein
VSARHRHYRGAEARRWPGQHLAVPGAVLHSLAFVGLSAHAVKLLFDMAAQFKGNNNGDLCAAWKVMQKRGWKSEDTLNKAKKELVAAKMIAETRKGGFPNRTTLYGLTWFKLDDCGGKLDVTQVAFPFGGFLNGIALPRPQPKNAGLNTPDEAGNAG